MALYARYAVGIPGSGERFQSIQAAYDQAVADGHDIDDPARVYVGPGDYTESVLMSVPGISIVANAQDEQSNLSADASSVGQGITRLLGDLTVVLPTAGTLARTTASWEGIDIVPGAGVVGLAFGSPDPSYLYVRNCQLVGTDVDVVTVASAGSTLNLQNVMVEGGAGGGAPLSVGDGNLRAFDCTIRSLLEPADNLLVDAPGTSVVFDTCHLEGGRIASNGFVTLQDCVILAPDELALVTGTIIVIDCEAKIGADPIVLGTGTFSHNNLTLIGAGGASQTLDATIIQVTEEGIPNEQYVREIVLPHTITLETSVAVTGPPASILTLPPISSRPGPIRIKEAAGAGGGHTVAAVGLDLIRVDSGAPAASVPIPAPAVGSAGGLILVADAANGIWEAYVPNGAGGGVNCLTEFLVSPVPGGGSFTTIGAAYAAAKAALHDPLSPAEILVCPGLYVEDVLMDQPGIDIIAVANDKYEPLRGFGVGITRLDGTLTIDLTGFSPSDEETRCAWRGIDILSFGLGLDPRGIVFTGIQYQQAFVSDCLIRTLGDAAVFGDNGAGGIPGLARLDMIRCGLENTEESSPSAFEWLEGLLNLSTCKCRQATGAPSFVGSPGGPSTATVRAAGTFFEHDWDVSGVVFAENCNLIGTITFTDPGGGGTVSAIQSSLLFAPAGPPNPVGLGTFVYDALPYAGLIQPFDPLTTAAQQNSVPHESDAIAVDVGAVTPPGFQITNETNLVGTTVGTFLLPPATSRNGPIRIKAIPFGPGAVAVDSAVGDTINGLPGPFPVPAAGATFVAFPPGDWETYG